MALGLCSTMMPQIDSVYCPNWWQTFGVGQFQPRTRLWKYYLHSYHWCEYSRGHTGLQLIFTFFNYFIHKNAVATIAGGETCLPGNQFECANGHCVHAITVCNGEDNCGDNSDELACSGESKLEFPNFSGFRQNREPEFLRGPQLKRGHFSLRSTF
jgi:hypothetical protein